eukprot:gene6167-4445_t
MSRTGFDKYTTIFSPEGTLAQVEYAFKAVTQGGLLSVAIRCKDSVVIVIQRPVRDRLMKPETVASLFYITDHIGMCTTGRAPDGNALVQRAREAAAEYKYKNGIPMCVSLLAKRLGDKAQVRTQSAGLRAMGVLSTLIGVEQNDETGAWEPQIYSVDPAGWVGGHFAFAAGRKYLEANSFLEKRCKNAPFDTLTEDQIAMIALEAVQHAVDASLKATDLEVGRVTTTTKEFERVPEEQVEAWLTTLAEAD